MTFLGTLAVPVHSPRFLCHLFSFVGKISQRVNNPPQLFSRALLKKYFYSKAVWNEMQLGWYLIGKKLLRS